MSIHFKIVILLIVKFVFTNHWVEYKAIWNEIYIYNVISYS